MTKQPSIVVTGTAGFIGSVFVQYLNEQGFTNLLLVDDFGVEAKRKNWEGKTYTKVIERQAFLAQLSNDEFEIDIIIHLGARTDTTEFNYAIHAELNVEYSIAMWNYATKKNIPLIYASSAATYGAGEHGYDDSHTILDQLKPLNPYGVSKNEFDKWTLQQNTTPIAWTGLKFFNVYGPNEGHKARMASVIFHSFNQIKASGLVKLFKSHQPDFKDGEQLRDFIYVKDVIEVCLFLYKKLPKSGLYNLGTGQCRSFLDLAKSTFKALAKPSAISFVDTPIDIRDKYQYFTEANMTKLKSVGYTNEFYSLENGITDYVQNYLIHNKYY